MDRPEPTIRFIPFQRGTVTRYCSFGQSLAFGSTSPARATRDSTTVLPVLLAAIASTLFLTVSMPRAFFVPTTGFCSRQALMDGCSTETSSVATV